MLKHKLEVLSVIFDHNCNLKDYLIKKAKSKKVFKIFRYRRLEMVEAYLLAENEEILLDASSNTIVVTCTSGTVQIYRNEEPAATLGFLENYTIPASTTTMWKVKAIAGQAVVVVSRFFIL